MSSKTRIAAGAAGTVLFGLCAGCALPSGGLLPDDVQQPYDGGAAVVLDGSTAQEPDSSSSGDDASVGVTVFEAGADASGEDLDTGAPEAAAIDATSNDGPALDGATDPEAASADTGPAVTCPPPDTSGDTALPFVVDANSIFVPSGYEGDAARVPIGAVSMPQAMGDPSCAGMRSSPSAVGSCHVVTYTPVFGGAGWAGVIWQHPVNNWGTLPGYAIPAGATSVSFAAKGAVGGEVVTFLVGGTGYGMARTAAVPCADPLSAEVRLNLSAAWHTYTINLGDVNYAGGVLTAFGFIVVASDQPAGRAATFYVDDIQWL